MRLIRPSQNVKTMSCFNYNTTFSVQTFTNNNYLATSHYLTCPVTDSGCILTKALLACPHTHRKLETGLVQTVSCWSTRRRNYRLSQWATVRVVRAPLPVLEMTPARFFADREKLLRGLLLVVFHPRCSHRVLWNPSSWVQLEPLVLANDLDSEFLTLFQDNYFENPRGTHYQRWYFIPVWLMGYVTAAGGVTC